MSISATPEYQKLKALATQNEDLLRTYPKIIEEVV